MSRGKALSSTPRMNQAERRPGRIRPAVLVAAIEPVCIRIIARRNAVLRHLAGRDRSRPELAEAGRGAEREHAAEPNAHGIFQCCRSHDCTYLLVGGR
jgi:hypothetical protein